MCPRGTPRAVSIAPSANAFSIANGGTLALSQNFGLNHSPNIGSGVTVTTNSAVYVVDYSGSGTVTTSVGLDVPILTKATTNYGARLGQGGQTLTAAVTGAMLGLYTGTTTLNFANATLPPAVSMTGAISYTQSGYGFGSWLAFDLGPTITNTVGSANGISFGLGEMIYCGPTYVANTQTGIGLGTQVGFIYSPTTSVLNSGTITGGSLTGAQFQPTINTGTSGVTVTYVSMKNLAGSGTVTTFVGLDIAQVTAATTNIGIRNASPTVYTPSSSQTLAAGTTVSPNATNLAITATGATTLTATPTITAGQAGQVIQIVNVGSNAITFQSNATLSGSNLSLGATTRAVGAKGSLTLIYNSTLTRWVELGFNAGGNG